MSQNPPAPRELLHMWHLMDEVKSSEVKVTVMSRRSLSWSPERRHKTPGANITWTRALSLQAYGHNSIIMPIMSFSNRKWNYKGVILQTDLDVTCRRHKKAIHLSKSYFGNFPECQTDSHMDGSSITTGKTYKSFVCVFNWLMNLTAACFSDGVKLMIMLQIIKVHKSWSVLRV